MHTCGKRGCKQEVDDKYRFCWEHRDTPYKDICKIHGEQTFIKGQCQKCKSLKRGIYRLYKRNGKYYFNRNKKPIDKNSDYWYLKPFFKDLTHKTARYQRQNASNIYDGPGVYGIFVRDKYRKNQLGQCLYIGQSRNIKARIKQHKKAFVTASNHLKGVRAQAKKKDKNKDWKLLIPKEKRKVENKYYELAKYNLKDLKFCSLVKIDKSHWEGLTIDQQDILLCMFEQLEMDVLSPKTNTFASRPSYL